ncbi:MAG: hypothetical protein OEZ01_08930, partial [Candidatus Heimdallarchaeota archaeon]|nr:hypothetical protein [Candidatus Heimdallarchaeota archaeon]
LLLIDLQGDLASLALMGDKKLAESKGTPGSYHDEIKNKAQVAIYTPASTKGIPISMNPLKAPPLNLDPEDFIQAVDSVADTIANILKYNTEKGKGLEAKNYLYLLLKELWESEREVNSFNDLANFIANDSDILDDSSRGMINDKSKEELAKSVKGLTIGADSLIFNLGIPLDIKRMMEWSDKGKTPVNVLYLNTLRSPEDRVNFIADTANQVYNWMLRNPSDKVQLVFVLDELAGLVPPIRNPPTKKSIQLLLKQARKYGVSLLLATQNISDVDYKSLGQVGTWALGRLMAKQDIEKVRDIVSAISPTETEQILSSLTKQTAGQFQLLAPDVYKQVKSIQARWLVTNHTTLDDTRVKEVIDASGIRDKFPDATGIAKKKRTKSSSEGKGGSPLDVEDAKDAGILSMEETDAETSDIAVPEIKKAEDILLTLENKPLAPSVEEIAEMTGESTKVVQSSLDKLVKSKKLSSEEVNGVKIYWSPKHKMDPENNIIGPLFRFHIEKPQGVAEKIMKDNIPKTLGIRAIESIIDNYTRLVYVPLWRIGVTSFEEQGRFMNKKMVEVQTLYYVNGMTGGILTYNKKEEILGFPYQGISNPKEDITTIMKEEGNYLIDSEVLDGLKDDDLRPWLNREDAIDQIKKLLGYRVNRKITPSIIWMPIWEFKLVDKDTHKDRLAWVDAVFGCYLEVNPLSDE